MAVAPPRPRANNIAMILQLLDLNNEANKLAVFGPNNIDANIVSFFNKYDDRELNMIVDDINAKPDIIKTIGDMKKADDKIRENINKISGDDDYKDMKDVLDSLQKELYKLQLKTILIKCDKLAAAVDVKGIVNRGKGLFRDLSIALTEKINFLNTLQDQKHELYNPKPAAPIEPIAPVPLVPPPAPAPAGATGGNSSRASQAARMEEMRRLEMEQEARGQDGGGGSYRQKYIKYKTKYLNLRKHKSIL